MSRFDARFAKIEGRFRQSQREKSRESVERVKQTALEVLDRQPLPVLRAFGVISNSAPKKQDSPLTNELIDVEKASQFIDGPVCLNLLGVKSLMYDQPEQACQQAITFGKDLFGKREVDVRRYALFLIESVLQIQERHNEPSLSTINHREACREIFDTKGTMYKRDFASALSRIDAARVSRADSTKTLLFEP